MEECGSTGGAHPWKAATMKRKAWALSRGSWQASESQDGHTEGQPSQEPTAHKEPPAEEPGTTTFHPLPPPLKGEKPELREQSIEKFGALIRR